MGTAEIPALAAVIFKGAVAPVKNPGFVITNVQEGRADWV